VTKGESKSDLNWWKNRKDSVKYERSELVAKKNKTYKIFEIIL